MRKKRTISLVVLMLITAALLLVATAPWAGAQPTERIEKEVLARRLMLYPTSSMYPGIIVDASGSAALLDMGLSGVSAFKVDNTGNTTITGAGDNVQFTVTGNSTQTSDLFLLENSAGTDRLTVNQDGLTTVVFDRADATGYEYGVVIEGAAHGVVENAKTRAVSIDLWRDAGYEQQHGNIEDTGLIVRVETEAITTTAGTVLRAVDAEAKADNPSGTVSNLFGGSFTAKSDTGAGSVDQMVGLQANAQNNAAVVSLLVAADFRTMRQAAAHPTEEYILHLRQSNTTGTGVDAGIMIESDGTGETDDFNYGIDMSTAEIDNADIRFQNGSTLYETTDTVIAFGEYVGFAEGAVETIAAGETIDPVATYHPIRADGAVATSTSTAVANGTFTGQIVILINETAQAITVDGAGGNVECGGDKALDITDTMTLLWDGADWICIAYLDN